MVIYVLLFLVTGLMRLTVSILFSACLLFALGCSSDQNQQVIQRQVPGTYQGTLPCADCEGIQLQLVLQDNGRYRRRMSYTGKSTLPKEDSGNWQIQHDSVVVLAAGTPQQQSFAVALDGTLHMLHQPNDTMPSTSASFYTLQRARPEAEGSASFAYQTKRNSGTDFVAYGNEPGWSLKVDFDSAMSFTSIQGDSVRFAIPEATEQGKEQRFEAETEAGPVRVVITEEPCLDHMYGEDFTHQVTVTINQQTVEGCGHYISPGAMAYEGRWLLTKIFGEDFSANDTTQIPRLDIRSEDTVVAGFTGCNRLHGTLAIAGDSIRFKSLMKTDQDCDRVVEKDFLKALREADTYRVTNGQLTLLDNEAAVMVLAKANSRKN